MPRNLLIYMWFQIPEEILELIIGYLDVPMDFLKRHMCKEQSRPRVSENTKHIDGHLVLVS